MNKSQVKPLKSPPALGQTRLPDPPNHWRKSCRWRWWVLHSPPQRSWDSGWQMGAWSYDQLVGSGRVASACTAPSHLYQPHRQSLQLPPSCRFPPIREGNRARVRFPLLAGGTLRRGSSIALVFVNCVPAIGITSAQMVVRQRDVCRVCSRVPKDTGRLFRFHSIKVFDAQLVIVRRIWV